MVCTFFGHRDCPSSVFPRLKKAIEDLIIYKNVKTFYVGCNGNFDLYVYKALKELKKKYIHIDYFVILAYIPVKHLDYEKTILPNGIENVPKRFAISYRNEWMLNNSDFVITYITHSYGGAAQFAQKAQKKKKICINLK